VKYRLAFLLLTIATWLATTADIWPSR